MHNRIYIFEVDEENIRDKRKTNNKKGGTIICCVRFGILPSLIRETEYLAVLNELCHVVEDGFLFRS